MIDEEKLKKIRDLFNERDRVMKEMKSIIASGSMNQVTLSCIYGALTALNTERDVKLFAIIYLCAPEVLIGRKMRVGLRSFLSNLFGFQTPSAISIRCRNLMFRYRHYREFRAGADSAISKAEEILAAVEGR